MNRPCKELKRIARENLVDHYGIPMGALLVAWVIPLAIELPFSMVMGEDPTPVQNVTFYVAEFLIGLINYILSAGVALIHLNIARKKDHTVKMVFFAFKDRPDRFLLAGFLQILLTLAGMIPFFAGYAVCYYRDGIWAYILLGITAVISILVVAVLSLSIAFTLYLMIDHPNEGVVSCLKNSVRTMKGHKKSLFYVYLSFLGLEALTLLSFGIGALWVSPYLSQTLANFYLDVTGQLPAPSQVPPSSDEYRSFQEYL